MDSTKSEISMEELLALGSYFSGNIPEDSAETDEEYIVTRPCKKFISSAPQRKRGTAPQWKYSERQREAAELIDLAYDRLRGTPGVAEFSGGTAKTDSQIIQREVEKIKSERDQVVPKKRGRPPKAKVEEEPKIPKKRGRPPKAKVEGEPNIPRKRGRPPKAKVEEEPKIPKKRGRPPKTVESHKTISEPRATVAERLLKQKTVKPKRQSVADRFKAQRLVRPVIPADSVVTKVGPGRYNIEVNLNKRPTRKAPDVPKGVKPWRPVPKPRTVFPRERPIPKPRTKLPKERPVPKPRTRLPIPEALVRVRKPVKQMKETEGQPPVVRVEEHEIDPFGTDLQAPGYRKIETAANGAAVTYSIVSQYMDPLDQLTSSRQVVRSILMNELRKLGGIKYTETLKVRMSKEVGNGKTSKDSMYFKSKTGTVTNHEDIEKTAAFNQQTILNRIETFQNLGSNWIMNIKSHYINIAMYKPLAGSSYMELPKDIK
ncbi:transcriptional regulator [Paramuricea clavata]|uniref:Transcriptional regulator n=1 Tax=Paramuricea clavata TaxID=317549 RepID=A0A7D9D7Z7_PARCT|nr:transcriptional regulator [Paramuricea clavata]